MDTKTLRQKILDLAIRGKLVPQDPNDEPASVLLERIKAEKERLIKEGKIKRSKKSAKTSDTPHYENVPFEVPEGWVWCKLDDLAFYKKGPFGSSLTKAMFVPKGKDTYKVYEQKNAIQKDHKLGSYYISTEKYCSLSGFAVHPNDIIVSCAGTIGETYVLPQNIQEGIINQALMLIRLYNREIEGFYLLYFDFILKQEAYKESKGTAIKNIPPFDVLKNFFIPIPPKEEQKRILSEVDKWMSFVDDIDTNCKDLQLYIKHTKSKILDLAIHGKLIPQDPNDEPAIELLKRINPDFTPCDNGHYTQLPDDWTVAPMQVLCYLVDGDKQNGIERTNLDVKYLRGEHDAKTLTSGKYVTANSLLILVDGENSGEVFRTPIDGYQGSTFKQLLINGNMNEEYVLQVINLHRKVLRESKVGSAIPHLDKKLFKAIEVPIPPYKEQQRIIKAINKAFMSLDIIMESL
ncbi:restriction endonuclease subunit S [Alistipes onderdonkii]|nr:restriction endonuclease subunit S [Alistipes onderdonkii]KAA2566176.1 restriction endonuclease subunit S [Alistipes onderdonkii]KAA2593177.1 restriction endonuclease subunit S [Alistipes onderdonkii]KAA2665331.1 restriction endonuclease subunit S [Alistipes onderdonkii]KAA2682004.1 restriction endonuclease subunit S [Alistipes onderdonkii]